MLNKLYCILIASMLTLDDTTLIKANNLNPTIIFIKEEESATLLNWTLCCYIAKNVGIMQ